MEKDEKKISNKRLLSQYDGRKHRWLRTAVCLVVLFVVVLIISGFIVGVSVVDGVSMLPTLKDGELVVYSRMMGDCHVDDIVAVKMPSGESFVKRVVAVEGDVVDLRDGALYVNGEKEMRSGLEGQTFAQPGDVRYPYTVETGKVFIVGDNREASVDSRTFGAVLKKQIRGRILF